MRISSQFSILLLQSIKLINLTLLNIVLFSLIILREKKNLSPLTNLKLVKSQREFIVNLQEKL